MATEARPKESKAILEPMPRTYVVENGLLFDYYPIKLGARQGNYISIEKLPPIMREGFVTFERKLYRVSTLDFLRSRVNVGQPAYVPNPVARSTDDTLSASSVEVTSEPTDESGSGLDLGSEERKALDLAFQDQIRALLALDDPEAEWVFETTTQS